MILYRVSIVLEAGVEREWAAWMKQVHIPEVMQTGCFVECHMYRVMEAAEPNYVMDYQCRSLEEYERYRDQFASALQKAHSDRYAGRVRGSRQLLEEV